jgi:hypothetical protein
MAVLRLDRFTIDPAYAEELVARHEALVIAAKDAFPGLIEAQLAKVDDDAWLTVWRWPWTPTRRWFRLVPSPACGS